MIKNKQDNIKMIEELNTSEDNKKILRKINTVASSENCKMKQSVKDLFVISPYCKELDQIGRVYERIIISNNVYPARGTNTYLGLAFPAMGSNDNEFKDFFSSPRVVAQTQNYFSGVFLISFERWHSSNELTKDVDHFNDLIYFIDTNKDHISYIFHVKPDFDDPQQLYSILAGHLNILKIEHSNPDLDRSIQYIEEQLLKSGLELSGSGKTEIRKMIKEKIDFNSSSYLGYRTLENIIADLRFEAYALICANDRIRDEKISVEQKDIKKISSFINLEYESGNNRRSIGFH